jgi:hypothetical protein
MLPDLDLDVPSAGTPADMAFEPSPADVALEPSPAAVASPAWVPFPTTSVKRGRSRLAIASMPSAVGCIESASRFVLTMRLPLRLRTMKCSDQSRKWTEGLSSAMWASRMLTASRASVHRFGHVSCEDSPHTSNIG